MKESLHNLIIWIKEKVGSFNILPLLQIIFLELEF